MKTQHINFEILNESLNIIATQLCTKMFLNGQVCKENFHPFAIVRDDATRSLDVCQRLACESIVSTICAVAWWLMPRTPDPEVGGSSPFTPQKYW